MANTKINALGGKLFRFDEGQAVAEYAAMLGLMLGLLLVARMIGFHANQIFQWVVAALQ